MKSIYTNPLIKFLFISLLSSCISLTKARSPDHEAQSGLAGSPMQPRGLAEASYKRASNLLEANGGPYRVGIALKDGRMAIATSLGPSNHVNTIQIWEHQADGQYKVVEDLTGFGPNHAVTSLTELSDGRLVTVANPENITHIWEKKNGRYQIVHTVSSARFVGELKSSGLLVWGPNSAFQPLYFLESKNGNYAPPQNLPLDLQQVQSSFCLELADGTLLVQKPYGGSTLWKFESGNYQKLQDITHVSQKLLDGRRTSLAALPDGGFVAYNEAQGYTPTTSINQIQVFKKNTSGKFEISYQESLPLKPYYGASLRVFKALPNGDVSLRFHRLEYEDQMLRLENGTYRLDRWEKKLGDPFSIVDGRYIADPESPNHIFGVVEKINGRYVEVFRAPQIYENGSSLYVKLLLVTNFGDILTQTDSGAVQVWKKQ